MLYLKSSDISNAGVSQADSGQLKVNEPILTKEKMFEEFDLLIENEINHRTTKDQCGLFDHEAGRLVKLGGTSD